MNDHFFLVIEHTDGMREQQLFLDESRAWDAKEEARWDFPKAYISVLKNPILQ